MLAEVSPVTISIAYQSAIIYIGRISAVYHSIAVPKVRLSIIDINNINRLVFSHMVISQNTFFSRYDRTSIKCR